MARSRNGRRKEPAPGWVWMLFGLALGLVVAGGVYLRGPMASGRAPAAERAATPSPPTGASSARSQRSQPAAERASDESRFDFYEILPQYEVVIPEVESAAPRARAQPVEEPGSYVLQVGSFNAFVDADRRKASLALLGIESRIQRVTIDDAVYHRVRIGPISDLDSLNRVRGQLRDAGIDSMLMKVPK